MTEDLTKLSKFLSYVLRHQPQRIGITLDPEGWASVDAIIAGAAKGGKVIARDEIDRVVADCEKKRFAFSPDGLRIRAVQGHSTTEVALSFESRVPPTQLYHGTATRFLQPIHAQGLQPGNRHHVHLSADKQLAADVGGRHGKPVVLTVAAAAMHALGHQFYLSENGVWLTEHVPPEFLDTRLNLDGSIQAPVLAAASAEGLSPPQRQIRAFYDDSTIRVYQAYSDAIASSALERGSFVSTPFKMDRMTWVKPSFLWMMYRSGWGLKDPGQSRILAIDMSRAGFEWALAHSCASHPPESMTPQEWEELKANSPVRVQWDPERDLHHQPLPHRAIQIGLSGEAVLRYVNEWVQKITDVTPLAHAIHAQVKSHNLAQAQSMLPVEKPYS